VYIILLASGINQQINKYFIDMIKAKCLPWDFFSGLVRMRGKMYNFNPLGPKLNRPHDLHLYTIVPDLVVKAMDKIKNLSTILCQIVDI
jgi:hypothetical protein